MSNYTIHGVFTTSPEKIARFKQAFAIDSNENLVENIVLNLRDRGLLDEVDTKLTEHPDFEFYLFKSMTELKNLAIFKGYDISEVTSKAQLLHSLLEDEIYYTDVLVDIDSTVTQIVPRDDKLYLIFLNGCIEVYDYKNEKFLNHLLDIRDVVENLYHKKPLAEGKTDERGLLSLEFSTDFEDTGHFYVTYCKYNDKGTNDNCIECLSRFTFNKSASLTKQSEVIIAEVFQPEWNHNSGKLLIDRDDPNYIFWSLGDGGGAGDDHGEIISGEIKLGNAQSDESPLGKIIRLPLYNYDEILRVNRNLNPLDYVYAKGFRNPWSMTYDDKGDIYIADVGQDHVERVVLLKPNHNYGWKAYEGSKIYSSEVLDKIGEISNLAKHPFIEYNHTGDGPSAIIGGYFIDDDYYYADFSGKLYVSSSFPTTDGDFRVDTAITPLEFKDQFITSLTGVGQILIISTFKSIYAVSKHQMLTRSDINNIVDKFSKRLETVNPEYRSISNFSMMILNRDLNRYTKIISENSWADTEKELKLAVDETLKYSSDDNFINSVALNNNFYTRIKAVSMPIYKYNGVDRLVGTIAVFGDTIKNNHDIMIEAATDFYPVTELITVTEG